MEIAIIGAGSLGSLVGGLLAADHDVTLVGREDHMAAVDEGGLRIVGQVDRTVYPAVRTAIEGLEADLALITVKAYDTAAVAEALAGPSVSVSTVASLQNGLGNEERLADALEEDTTVLAGIATYGARLRTPGVVACTGQGSIDLGARPGAEREAAAEAQRIVAVLEDAISIRYESDMETTLWSKLAINAGVNPVTALADCRNGVLANGPAGEIATAAAREVASVAQAVGVDLPVAAATDALETVVERTATNRSSMAVDCVEGRRTEIDAINGYVVDRAGDAVTVPVNHTLWSLIRSWEYARGLRDGS